VTNYFTAQYEPVEHEGNTVWLLPKIGQGVMSKITAHIRTQTFGLGSRGGGDPVYINALLRFNIVKWEGPMFRGDNGKTVPCTPQNIDVVPIDDPLMVKALERINELNKRYDPDEPQEDDPEPDEDTKKNSNGSNKKQPKGRRVGSKS
jgi:hypothetical protein